MKIRSSGSEGYGRVASKLEAAIFEKLHLCSGVLSGMHEMVFRLHPAIHLAGSILRQGFTGVGGCVIYRTLAFPKGV